MKTISSIALVLVGASAILPGALQAHHSFAAEFDRNQPVTLEGVVSKLEWANPHTRLYLMVQTPEGQPIAWEFELASPNGLLRAGWTRHSVQVGDKLTIKGFMAKDGSHLANAASVVTPDGRTILSESTVATNVAPK